MNVRVIAGNLGTFLRLFSFTLLVPVVGGFLFEARSLESVFGWQIPPTAPVFLATFLGTFVFGATLERLGVSTDVRDREAYVLVGVGWITCTLIAAIPYLATGVLTNPAAAFFEAMSGLTTTGATVIAVQLETLPEGLHVWRAFTQWLGGMGIIVLYVAVLAKLTAAGAKLMQAELPGGEVDRVRPGILQTARTLWTVYAGLSAVLATILFVLVFNETGSLRTAGLDAVVHTFTTMSTGGFSTRTASIQAFESAWIESVIAVFIVLAGTNFALTYRSITNPERSPFDDDEFTFYLAVLAGGAILLAAVLFFASTGLAFWRAHGGHSLASSIRLAAFQAVSIITTTGYSTANFEMFPEVARFLLVFFMFIGGSAGSTAGSIKIVRVLILFRLLKAQLSRIVHPRAVIPVRVGHEVIKSEKVQEVAVFVFAYLTFFVAGTLGLLLLEPVEVLDAASAVAASIGNVGPALGTFGPLEGYAHLSDPSMIMLALLMWLGRLELFAVLVLFSPETYR